VLHEFLGASTRMVGGLIMLHGDDDGLVVPPRLAPIQAVVIAVRDESEVNDACERVATSFKSAGLRVRIDHGRGSFGRRVTDWEIKGVPLRVEVGPAISKRESSRSFAATTGRSSPSHSTSWPRRRAPC